MSEQAPLGSTAAGPTGERSSVDVGFSVAADVDLDDLVFSDEAPGPDDVPPRLQPGEEVMVVRSYRIPVELDAWLREQAEARRVTRSDLVRDLIELGRIALTGTDRSISLADAIRALTNVRPLDAA